jgi:succinate dehydrogenase/fumarate reductase flavoprotein subunit
MSMSTPQTPEQCDLLVIGSGAGALSAAVTAAHLGLKVIVVEKDPQYGGTTAWSGGWIGFHLSNPVKGHFAWMFPFGMSGWRMPRAGQPPTP